MAEKNQKKEKRFEVSGRFMEKGNEKKFAKVVEACNENTAAERAMSLMGSKHKTKRRCIFIEETKEVQEK